ncbi:Helix-turn-helix domain [Frankia torreyi]|uniref:Helix-turn-helix domain n=1 Tax=Frankia torreyi TaxID=1856 RepID=A0A0D8BAX2_9ACTN|nr:helix-turn-helix transcriptional regulator [Frankia torreyi]KJE21109.1 Helix-turn-helix domain [Frankia torreyi]
MTYIQAQSDLGARLARARKQADLTQQELAHRVSYSRSTIANTESGRQCPPRSFWADADAALGTGGALTADFDRITSSSEPSTPPATADNSTAAAVRPGGPGESVARLRDVLDHYRRLDDLLGASGLVGPVTAHLGLLEQVGRAEVATATEVDRLEAETCQLLAWLWLDLDKPARARDFYARAVRAARRAGDDALASYMIGWLSFAACGDDPRDAVVLARMAVARGAGGPASLRAWLAAVAGRAHAHVGDREQALHSLGEAERLLPDAPDRRAAWYFFGSAAYTGYRGTSLVLLGQARDAQRLLEDTLAGLDGTFVRSRALYEAQLAHALADLDELEQACRHAHQAAEVASATGTVRGLRAVRDVRRHPLLAANPSHRGVMDLDEYLLFAS